MPSKVCQTSSTSYGNSPRIGKQEHPITVGAIRLDLTQHHLCKGSCSAVGPSPSFTQYVDIIRIPEDIPQVSALVDSGATSSFIDQTFVAQHNIPMVKKSTPVLVEVIDGRTIASGAITHKTTPLELYINKHTEKIVLNIISTLHHPIILGLPWLERTTLSLIGDLEPSPSAHNGALLKNPKLRKTFCPVLPRTLWSRTQRGSEPILVFSSLLCQVLQSRTPRWPELNLVLSRILSRILPRKPTLSGSLLMELSFSIGLLRMFKSSPSMSTQPTTKTPNQNQHLSNFPRSSRTLLMFLKILMLISSPPIVHMTARLI